MNLDQPFPNTIWNHKKTGRQYIVLSVATHTETGEKFVIYTREAVWARPLEMFMDGRFEEVDPRFKCNHCHD